MEDDYNIPDDIDRLKQENIMLKDELCNYYRCEESERAETEFLTRMVMGMKRLIPKQKYDTILMASLYAIHENYESWDFESVLNSMSKKLGFKCHEWDDFCEDLYSDALFR